ncbi:MAG TPA: hypothetical protein VGC30_02050 [Dokdonella sp.]
MPGRDGALNPNPEAALSAALRALPDAAPQPDLWPALARELAPPRRRLRRALPAALAAGVALALALAYRAVPRGDAPAAAAPAAIAAAPSSELDRLQLRSQALEHRIAGLAQTPQEGRDLMAAVEIEDLIGLVDVQLDAARGDDDALPLWRQRVALLEDLATIRGGAYALAVAEPRDAGLVPAAPHRMN